MHDNLINRHESPPLQVNDISVWGSPEEAAQLLLPRGSVAVSATAEAVQLPAKETPVGLLEIPPRSYYR
jgi:hypothetical protein